MTSATPVVPPQPSGPNKVVQFYHDVSAEMKRVTWPDRAQLQDATIKIIVFVLALGAIIALLDLALQFILVQLPALLLGR
ncbi:preprotein translocase subunit SecE [Roseisolibacter sp. H3M3-2]|uniref:preprotein translocase subunit SecE n=1 Tax=Roseisolibacter sp. H3M3-2 TaxID=3031323 RepID=UPI0023DB7BCF|nr:preprotein translocase subunit SecE [Roseisolibacter sp. H3M3-2]MDF1503155.1 preprotein translocase subunit SecE [Roseisolibacter sp. H3M3-2]